MLGGRWVCLMYHDVVTETNRGGSRASGYFAVDEKTFTRQLELLRDVGLMGCSIEAMRSEREEGRVAISFDDGDVGQYWRAFPALAQVSMSATFFITTSWVGRDGYISWDGLREMKAAGMEIGSHTHTHPFLSELSPEAVSVELRRSKDLLDEHLCQETTAIALPGGDAPVGGDWAFEDAHYRLVATSRWGRNPVRPVDQKSVFKIRRCTVRMSLGDATFRRIATGSPWLSYRRRAREALLHRVRRTLGPSRYARWRRHALGLLENGR